MEKLFFIDDAAGVEYAYARLRQDVAMVETITPVLAFVDGYEFFMRLVAAIENDARVALMPNVEAGECLSSDGMRSSDILGTSLGTGSSLGLSWSLGLSLGVGAKESIQLLRESKAELGVMTSGSTGAPKLVWHAMDSLTRAVRVDEGHADDVWGLAYHPAHFAGLQVFFQALANHNTLVRLFGLEPDAIHRAIDQHHLTHISATPTFLNLLCSDKSSSHPTVKRITTGGERLPTALIQRITALFPNAKLTNIYASTETGSLLVADGEYFTLPLEFEGRIKIIDGELAVHQSLLAKSIRTNADRLVDSEYFLTGDQVEQIDADRRLDIDADNPPRNSPVRFRFLGRRQDEINVGGFKVNPLEVEELLLAMDEVAEARVYGRANSVTGYLVACDLVLQPNHSLSTLQIRQRLSPHLASYKLPRIVHVVDKLPTTYSGKQDRLH